MKSVNAIIARRQTSDRLLSKLLYAVIVLRSRVDAAFQDRITIALSKEAEASAARVKAADAARVAADQAAVFARSEHKQAQHQHTKDCLTIQQCAYEQGIGYAAE